MLPGASPLAVQQLHRSIAWCVSHMPISSPPVGLSRFPCFRKDSEFHGGVQPSFQAWTTLLNAWPGMRFFERRRRPGSKLMACMARNEDVPADGECPNFGVAAQKRPIFSGEIDKKLESIVSSMEEYGTNGIGPKHDYHTLARPQGWIRPVDRTNQIFCNRSLNMKSIVAVGFDMDYTLAQYKADTFETLAYVGTVKKLVYDLHYPEELLDWKFDWRYMVRGLVLDKKRGNILKMDRHKYVKVAYHGFKEMSRDDRQAAYGSTLSRESFDEPDYALIDTLFSLAEAYLFAQVVELKDSHPERIPSGADYAQIYRDVRAAVDLCHRDGTLKQAVANNPSMYIYEDPKLVPMLRMLRESGRLTFLVTNSLWDYTHVVMNFLFGKCGTKGGVPRDDEWLSYFDIVITGSAKPAFFMESNRAPLLEVDLKSGMMLNTDNGSPLAQIGESTVDTQTCLNDRPGKACRVFQGGSVTHLHKLLGIEASAQVMYVGDHIYGDILRSKKALGWRTMLVVPELEKEMELLKDTAELHKEVQILRQLRDTLEDTLQQLLWQVQFGETAEMRKAAQSEIEPVQTRRDRIREQHRFAQRECHHRFHKVWGQLMKTGYQNSRFGHQVERFACLYTSQVTNLCHYSPDKLYRPTEDYMPHEMDVLNM
ncbi:hypothetical protein MPTK1_6g21370 [Marchantia polymorpha subsp. ruderalis]|uniref:5'-nucleotidase n=2 Tax=Marchantia polymorpha TaxID=3197 RepID=A0AAF6BUH6_MARPO|nr:hypothetical protein MARPO_0091s0018 [Marchantia polymorpha]BBN15660.1 hypothetical protein Mp_6g21370 [Marchantia polymorpha subsp. ruderalis]|eukprot:PTQ33154.1 hypothetical protein MARPO_0091s0018 [Marchantia polymorpha]